jgi:hypothetical protein
MEKTDPKNEEFRRFRAEAESLLGIKQQNGRGRTIKSSNRGHLRTYIASGVAKRSGRCVSAAKQNPHRPGIAPALGLRAGRMAFSFYRRHHLLTGDANDVVYFSHSQPDGHSVPDVGKWKEADGAAFGRLNAAMWN